MSLDTPVVLLIYNRPALTVKALAGISRVRPRTLFVIGDGPAADRPADDQRVENARAVIDHVNWPCNVATNYSPVNLGCKQRVSSGLNWVFNHVAEAIVIEDDCVADPTFFTFCEQMLVRYRGDRRVLSIGGANFQEHVTPMPNSYYFSKYFRCWGWASWRRAWEDFDVAMREWPEWKSNGGLKSFSASPVEERYWRKVFDDVYAGRIDSWAYAYSFASFRRGGLHVQPSVNLVSNIGFIDDATNTTQANHRFANYPVTSIHRIEHPTEIVASERADRYTFSDVYHGYRLPRHQRLLASVRKRLQRVAQCWSLLNRLRRRIRLWWRIHRARSRQIIVGTAGSGQPGWITTDQKELNLLDPRDWEFQFRDGSVDAILAEHVWEHLTDAQGHTAAQVCFRYLKPRGYLRVAVPDGLHPDPDYIDWVRPRGKGPGADDHKVLYTYTTFQKLFEQAGFSVQLLEFFDESGSFHHRRWDPRDGMIHRSQRFDKRNADGRLRYTSIILDAVKPPAGSSAARRTRADAA